MIRFPYNNLVQISMNLSSVLPKYLLLVAPFPATPLCCYGHKLQTCTLYIYQHKFIIIVLGGCLFN